MSSQWISRTAIMRDLSLAQGFIPVDVAGTVSAEDKPPSQHFIEQTEEDFYRNWVGGDGDFSAPDLGLITHMLNVVRNQDVSSDAEEDPEKVIQISKLNSYCPVFVPQNLSGNKEKKSSKPVKQKLKKNRNAAVLSLLELEEGNKTFTEANQVKPSTIPNDNSMCINSFKANNKVSQWLNSNVDETPKQSKKKNTPTLDLDPMSMFKKKNVTENVSKPVQEVRTTAPQGIMQYVPSAKAVEYYKKFLECSKMKAMVQENVWTKVEMQMKGIDERRKAEAELFALSVALCGDDPVPTSHISLTEESLSAVVSLEQLTPSLCPEFDDPKWAMVRLPQHRHLLSPNCTVCAFTNKEELASKENSTTQDSTESLTQQSTSEVEKNAKDLQSWRSDDDYLKSWRNKVLDDFESCTKHEVLSWRSKPNNESQNNESLNDIKINDTADDDDDEIFMISQQLEAMEILSDSDEYQSISYKSFD